jgi:effector-binding domain-containing protein
MTDYRLVDVPERPYLFVPCKAPGNHEAVSRTMVAAFGEVMGFMRANGIAVAGPPLAIYYVYGHEEVEFRAGVFVSGEDAGKSSGRIEAAVTPAGRVLSFTHVGPYRELGATYDALMAYLDREGLKLGAPSWEVYVDDPEEVPEDGLRTEIFVTVE